MDWTTAFANVAISVFSASVIGALAAWNVQRINARHRAAIESGELTAKIRKTDRGDEIDVLQKTIDQLREDSNSNRRYFDERIKLYDKDMAKIREEQNKSKSEHTACLVRCGQLREHVRHLMKRVGSTKEQSALFDSEEKEFDASSDSWREDDEGK